MLAAVVSTAAFVLIFALFDYVFGDVLQQVGAALLELGDWFGIFATFFVAAVCIVPIPDHAVSVLAWIGGLDMARNIAFSTAGSAAGAAAAYLLGRKLGKTRVFGSLLNRYESSSKDFIEKYGSMGIIFAAATPFPFSPVCWIAGMLDFSFLRFILLVIAFRAFKVTYVLLLTQQGLLLF